MTIRKTYITLLLLLLCCITLTAKTIDGNPYVVNFTSEEYNAHNRNFDVVADENGNVFFANFEGLLYYNGAEFRVMHTPGISRVTTLLREDNGMLWIGGYNVMGYLTSNENAQLLFKAVASDRGGQKIGEITKIERQNKSIVATTLSGIKYVWNDNKLTKFEAHAADEDVPQTIGGVKINHELTLPSGEKLLATAGDGVICLDKDGQPLFHLNQDNGLCDDNVNKLAYNGHGRVWGATDNGIFCLAYPSAFTRISLTEGLYGEVLSIAEYNGIRYVGTMQGIYTGNATGYQVIEGANGACWQLRVKEGRGVYAATASGLLLVNGTSVRNITHQHTLAVLPLDDGTCIAAQLKDVVQIDPTGAAKPISVIDNVIKIMQEKDGDLFLQDVYGNVYYRSKAGGMFKKINKDTDLPDNAVMSLFDGNTSLDIISDRVIYMWNAEKSKYQPVDTLEEKFQYPEFIFTDENRFIWMTDNEGKNITPFLKREIYQQYVPWLQNFDDEKVSAMYTHGDNILFGSKKGIITWNLKAADPAYDVPPAVYIRSVGLGNDSVIWGGFDGMVKYTPRTKLEDVNIGTNHSVITIAYSTAVPAVVGKVEYRYRLNDGRWTAWHVEKTATFSNMASGSYTFQVQARDAFGRVSPTATVDFHIAYPWYMRWWSILIYLALLALAVRQIVWWYNQRLRKKNEELEEIVAERTAEVVKQKEEVEEKSKSLEKAYSDLKQAQEEKLKAQEEQLKSQKMATVGNLTKGLIDRILNPINYINNFSNMSKNLANDVSEDIEDEKEKMDPEVYDDIADTLDMIKLNLSKVVDHGTSTSRILKAMEEMIKDRVGKMVQTDIADVCRQDMEMLNKYYEADIKAMGIETIMEGCDEPVIVTADPSQLSKCIVNMLGNSVYAVKKKFAQGKYQGQVKLSLEQEDDNVIIRVYDNGIGIEEKNQDSVFEPFFSTKPTAEAPGVGLYLTKEIVEAHGGTIELQSKQNEFTEFKVTLKNNAL